MGEGRGADAPEDGLATVQLTEGDIYFWRWKTPREHMPYHCYSQKAIVRKGRLLDTFWYDMTSDRAINPAHLDLVYQGNENELRKINEWEIDYYEHEQVVDMRHSNSSGAPVYVQANAVRSQSRMLEYLKYKREREESKIRMAQHTIERIDEAIAKVSEGQLDGYLP